MFGINNEKCIAVSISHCISLQSWSGSLAESHDAPPYLSPHLRLIYFFRHAYKNLALLITFLSADVAAEAVAGARVNHPDDDSADSTSKWVTNQIN